MNFLKNQFVLIPIFITMGVFAVEPPSKNNCTNLNLLIKINDNLEVRVEASLGETFTMKSAMTHENYGFRPEFDPMLGEIILHAFDLAPLAGFDQYAGQLGAFPLEQGAFTLLEGAKSRIEVQIVTFHQEVLTPKKVYFENCCLDCGGWTVCGCAVACNGNSCCRNPCCGPSQPGQPGGPKEAQQGD